MAILKSADGKFYDVPDTQLESYQIPGDQVKEKLKAAGGGMGAGGPGPRGRGPIAPVVVQIFGTPSFGMGPGGPPAGSPTEAGAEVSPYHCHRCHRCHRCHHCHHCHY